MQVLPDECDRKPADCGQIPHYVPAHFDVFQERRSSKYNGWRRGRTCFSPEGGGNIIDCPLTKGRTGDNIIRVYPFLEQEATDVGSF